MLHSDPAVTVQAEVGRLGVALRLRHQQQLEPYLLLDSSAWKPRVSTPFPAVYHSRSIPA